MSNRAANHGCRYPSGFAEQGLHPVNNLSILATHRAIALSQTRSQALEAARATSGPDRQMCVRIARQANHSLIHVRRTALESERLLPLPLKPRNRVRQRVLAEGNRVMGDRYGMRRDLGPPVPRQAHFFLALGMWACAAIMFLLALSARADAGTLDLEVSVGANVSEYLSGAGRFNQGVAYDGGFAGPRDTIEFAFVWRSLDQRWFVKLSHISHLSAGPPFNNKPEDFLERLEFGYRWRIGGAQ
jgi:hypothetical protein